MKKRRQLHPLVTSNIDRNKGSSTKALKHIVAEIAGVVLQATKPLVCFKRKVSRLECKALVLLAAVLLLVSPWTAQGAEFSLVQVGEGSPEETWLIQAKEAEARHDFERAAQYYTNYLKRYPDRPEILERLGLAYYLSNRFAAALIPLEKALKLDPTLWGAAMFLGISNYRAGRFEEALKPLRRALQIKPGLSAVHFWLGSTLLALGRNQEAIAELQEIPADSPEWVEAAYLLIDAYRKAAESYYRRIGGIAPDSYRLHQLQAESYVWKGKDQAAIAEYRRALEQKKDLEGAHRAIGDVYWQQGWFDLGAGEYQEELRVTPLDDQAHLRLGEYWLSRGNVDRAIEHLKLSLRANKDSSEAYRALGQAWLAQGEFVKAEPSLKTAVQHDPSDPLSHKLLGELYRRLGKSDLAEKERELFEKLSSAKARISGRPGGGSGEVESLKKLN